MKKSYYLLLAISIILTTSRSIYAQTAAIDSADRERERQRWNESLVHDTAYHFNKKPNEFLAQSIKGLRPGKAVDVAMGQGRNAIFLARMGWDVTGFDIADEALAYARTEAKRQHLQLKTVQQGQEEFDFGAGQYDLVSYIYSGCIEDVPGMAERIYKGLKPGGIVVFEFFHRDAGIAIHRNDFGCPANAEKDVLLKAGFEIKSYEEKMGMADYGLNQEKLVYMIAQKMAAK